MVQRHPNQHRNSSTRTKTTTLAITIGILLLSVLLAASLQSSTPLSSSSSGLEETRAALAKSSISRMLNPVKSLFVDYWGRSVSTAATSPSTAQTASLNNHTSKGMASRTPVYFVSHGGPTTMYNTKHPVWPELQAIGREITQNVKPSAIVVFSAHWQAQRPNTIEVNVSEQEPLLYDFYGFPRHYYAEKFPNKGSPGLARKIIGLLNENGIRTQEEERGLDHGAFVPFKVMFDPKENPVSVPIVQVSLFDDDTDAEAHIKLGQAVQKLREENILIICSGMSIHNLRHLMVGGGKGNSPDYALNFDQALKDAAETKPGAHRDGLMVELLQRSDARLAHPTFEHLLPAHIAVGAAGEDKGKQLFTLVEGPLAWAQYRFGEIAAAS